MAGHVAGRVKRGVTGAMIVAGLTLSQGGHAQSAPAVAAAPAECAAEGKVRFICGQAGPEDLVQVPGTPWILVSSYERKGLKIIDRRTERTTTIYPAAEARNQFDSKTYAGCPGPLKGTDLSAFHTHGLAIQRSRAGGYTAYVVHHGERESVEVFTLQLGAKVPRATWIGCVVAPMPIGLNSIVPLPDGGFITSNFRQRGEGDADARAKMAVGANNAELYEWHSRTGLVKVPGSEASGPNGLELSRDGKWIYFAGWGSKTFERLSRGVTPVKRDSVPVGFRLDNLRMGPDGQIYGAGQPADAGTRVIRVDPVTLKVTELLSLPGGGVFDAATAAIPVGKEVWVGSFHRDRIAVFTPDK